MGCLYRLISPSGKSYFGITIKTAEQRFGVHVSDSRKTAEFYTPILYAIRKYGPENFQVITVYESDVWEELCEVEKEAIRDWGTKAPNGYNLTDGGDGVTGAVRSERWKQSARAGQKKRRQDPEQRRQLQAAGERAQAVIKQRREFNKLVNLQLEAQGIAAPKKRTSPEHAAAISRAKKGIPMKEEDKKKASEGSKRAWGNPVTKAAMVEAQRRVWNDPVRVSEIVQKCRDTKAANGFVQKPPRVILSVAKSVASRAVFADPVKKADIVQRRRDTRRRNLEQAKLAALEIRLTALIALQAA